MEAMDQIGREDFCRLVNRTKSTLAMHRQRGELLFWCEPPQIYGGIEAKRLAYDAALFLISNAFVDQGPSWKGVGVTLPGLATDRSRRDRPARHLRRNHAFVGQGIFDRRRDARRTAAARHDRSCLSPLADTHSANRRGHAGAREGQRNRFACTISAAIG